METDKRLINANALVEQFSKEECRTQTRRDFIAMVHYAPTVDATEVAHGRWIPSKSMALSDKCSVCHGWVTRHSVNERKYRYCPNCGSKMDEEGRFVGICERCAYRDECDWPKLHPKIELKKCPDFNEGEKNKNG